ncbi:hypothetical protein [Halococcus sp. AFM35]|uniref:hypothetical protein n=1 Tax=Halococcus sp. AFM35 TaxID=3421653 RepID=UPI003EBE4A33
MGLITGLVRLVWFVTVGWMLGSAYFLLMFLMSPFFTLASGSIIKNTRNIMFLTSGS